MLSGKLVSRLFALPAQYLIEHCLDLDGGRAADSNYVLYAGSAGRLALGARGNAKTLGQTHTVVLRKPHKASDMEQDVGVLVLPIAST